MSTRLAIRTWSKGSARGSGPRHPRATVSILTVPLQRCDDCGGWMAGTVRQGAHAPHYSPTAGGLVNCVGMRIAAHNGGAADAR